jgi:hypothetical protein
MLMNLSLRALRETNPRNQPGFDESIERYDALRTKIVNTAEPRRASPRIVHKRALGVSIAGALVTVAAVLAGVMLSGGSTQSAYAAANEAVAATSAGALDSGTMTLKVTHGDKVWTLDTTRWNGDNISIAESYLGRQLLLIGGEAYVLQPGDGRWTHYPSEDVGFKQGPMVDLARADVAGSNVSEILAATTGLEKTVQPDGSTIYRGTIENSNADPAIAPGTDSAMRMIIKLRSGNEPDVPGGHHNNAQFQLVVGSDGLVRQVSVTFQQVGDKPTDNGTYAWSIDYSKLGSTPAVTAPDPSNVVEAPPVESQTTDTTPTETTTTS